MRISDWSSDVCSSDLPGSPRPPRTCRRRRGRCQCLRPRGASAPSRPRGHYGNGRLRPAPLPGHNVAGRGLVWARGPAERGVAVGKAAEAFDEVVAGLRIAELPGLAQLGEKGDRELLLVQVLAMLEGDGEK